MMLIEAAIAQTLQRSGPCCLYDLVTSLSSSNWGEVFAAVDRMSRDGRVVLHQRGFSTYQISLGSRRTEFTSPTSVNGMQTNLSA